MSIRRVVPNIKSQSLDETRAFYVDLLGFKVGMDMGFIVTLVSPSNPTAQISLLRDNGESSTPTLIFPSKLRMLTRFTKAPSSVGLRLFIH